MWLRIYDLRVTDCWISFRQTVMNSGILFLIIYDNKFILPKNCMYLEYGDTCCTGRQAQSSDFNHRGLCINAFVTFSDHIIMTNVTQPVQLAIYSPSPPQLIWITITSFCKTHRFVFVFCQQGAEKQAQLERSLREKSAVEKELEKVNTNLNIVNVSFQVVSTSTQELMSGTLYLPHWGSKSPFSRVEA